jgi:hypothetical protein
MLVPTDIDHFDCEISSFYGSAFSDVKVPSNITNASRVHVDLPPYDPFETTAAVQGVILPFSPIKAAEFHAKLQAANAAKEKAKPQKPAEHP